MYRILLLALFTLFAQLSSAQIPASQIKFDNKIFDFGKINFRSAPIQATFSFTNTSAYPMVIRDVKAECGCTVPSWPKTAIDPGQTAEISARFNPDNYAGEINKKIEVYANFQDAIAIPLHIVGTIRQPAGANSGFVKGQFGYLRMLGNVVAYGKIKNTETYTSEMIVVNDYSRPLKITKVVKKPSYAAVSIPQGDIAPGDTAFIKVTVDGAAVGDYGLQNDVILYETNDIYYSTKSFELALDVEHDFGKMTKGKLKKAPKIVIEPAEVDMGIIRRGARKSKKITIKNSGKRDLEIFKVTSDCSCAMIANDVKVIPAGGSQEVTVAFDSVFKSGEQRKYIYIYTNDPIHQVVKLLVHARVDE